MPECHSTNDVALERCQQENPTEGTVIFTDNQTAGRGQRGNAWFAEPGKNLTFSLILKPSFLAVRHQFQLNIILSLAVHDFLSKTLPDVRIKWPNDILVNNKKICGMLIENSILGQTIRYAVCGIGLNVNQRQWPEERITAMAMVTHQDYDLKSVLASLLECIEVRYLQLRSGNHHETRQEYLDRLIGFNHPQQFITADGTLQGMIVGVDEEGQLQVQTEDALRTFRPKEIQVSSTEA